MKKFFVLLLILLPKAFLSSGCNFGIDEIATSIDDARGTIRDGLDKIGHESERWRDIVEKEIIPLIDKRLTWVIADLQVLLSTNVANMTNGINCAADSFPLRITRGLNDILTNLDGKRRLNFIYPKVCTTSLHTIDLARPASQRRQVILSGYDFIGDYDFELWAVKNDNKEQFIPNRLTRQNDYSIVLDITNLESLFEQSKQLVVKYKEEIILRIPILK